MNYGRAVVSAALEELGVDYTESYNSSWGDGFCPLHNDSSPSFTINLDEGGWKCYSGCGSSGDLAALVSAVTGEAIEDARRRLLRGLAFDETILQRLSESSPRVTLTVLETPEDEFKYEHGKVPKYITRRGFTNDTIRAWDVGWDPDIKAIVIPVHQNGRLVGLVRRKLEGHPKYLNTAGLAKSNVLLGLDHLPFGADEVTIVEGPMDVMWLYQHGYAAVATLGASLSVAQADVIRRRFWRVTIAYDADKAGIAATARAKKLLEPTEVRTLTLPEGRHDIQECSAEELAEAYSNLV